MREHYAALPHTAGNVACGACVSPGVPSGFPVIENMKRLGLFLEHEGPPE